MEDVSITQTSYPKPANWVHLPLVREAKAIRGNVSACASLE
jgi:hypothetical protein